MNYKINRIRARFRSAEIPPNNRGARIHCTPLHDHATARDSSPSARFGLGEQTLLDSPVRAMAARLPPMPCICHGQAMRWRACCKKLL
jgi:hypothetical protein